MTATALRRSACLAAVALATLVGGAPSPAQARHPPTVRPSQSLAVLLSTHKVYATLHPKPVRTSTVEAVRPLTGSRTVLPVLGHRTTADGRHWLLVRLPGRPNSGKGWIARRATQPTSTPWRLAVSTGRRLVSVYRRGRLVRTFSAVVGKPSTPTPHGFFFVEESILMPAGSAGAPYALALSARSNVLQEFEGGPGQIALHGVANLGGVPGTAVSHGCVRLANANITWLITRIAPGVPVTIRS